MKRRQLFLLFLLSLLFIPSWITQAAGNVAVCSEAALDTALAGGGIVTFSTGLCTITVTTTKVIAINTTINGGGVVTISGGNAVRIFSVNPGVTLDIDGLTVSNGFGLAAGPVTGGGALLNDGGTVNITNSTFSNNNDGGGHQGGAIINYFFGVLNVSNSVFTNNTALGVAGAGGSSGAIVNYFTLTITNSTFTNNSANIGGVTQNVSGTIIVTGSTFSNNSAVLPPGGGAGGGALYNDGGTLTIINSTFDSNTEAGDGGGALTNIHDGVMTVTGSTFVNNSSTGASGVGGGGGAILNGGGGGTATLTVTNSTFIGNSTAITSGGAIRNLLFAGIAPTITIRNGTFSGNSGANGGNFSNEGGTITLINTIVQNGLVGGNCGGVTPITDGGSNLQFGDATCGGTIPVANPVLGALGNNGGLTQTMLPGAGSAAIDGVVAGCPPPATDQRGVARPVGARCDIGATEGAGVVGVTLTESGGTTDVAEGGATDTYTVVLNTVPTGNVNITVTPDAQCDLGAGAGVAITLAFTPANALVAQTVTVTAFDDLIVEGPHTCTITHVVAAGSAAEYLGAVIPNVVANVADNDVAGATVVESGGTTNVAEGGVTDAYTVVLNMVPTGNVNITVTPDGQCDLGAGAGVAITLAFTPANALAAQTVTVTAFDDLIVEGPHTCTITHVVAAGSAAEYLGVVIPNVVANITDNDGVVVPPVVPGGAVLTPPPSLPLCADLNGSTNSIIRANVPGGTVTDGSVFCHILVEHRIFHEEAAEIGNAAVLDMGILQAVDIFGLRHDGSSAPDFNYPVSVCLQGSGSFIYLDATTAPRVFHVLSTTQAGGYTCADIPDAGTVVLVTAAIPANVPAVVNQGAVIPLTDCRVTITRAVRLRAEPNTTSPVLATLAYQLSLEATARQGNWYKVIYLDGQGWVSGDYLTPSDNCR